MLEDEVLRRRDGVAQSASEVPGGTSTRDDLRGGAGDSARSSYWVTELFLGADGCGKEEEEGEVGEDG